MAAQLVRITSEVEVPYLTYQGQPVLTFALIDKVHNRVEGTAGRNFRSNRQRFIGKEDFYDLDSESLDEIRRNHPGVIGEAAQHATLITESGYLMLVKSFTDDLSWQIQRQLVKLYFRVKEAVEQPHPRLSPEQWQAIQEVIHGIGVCCKYDGKARFAANERIRFAFGLQMSNELPPEHFEEAMADLQGVKALAEQHQHRLATLDEEFITAVIRPPVSIRKVRAMARKHDQQPPLSF